MLFLDYLGKNRQTQPLSLNAYFELTNLFYYAFVSRLLTMYMHLADFAYNFFFMQVSTGTLLWILYLLWIFEIVF